ncbi:MAG: CoA transferase [Acidimicrobiales bacterium]|nr:CoA transferase [Acidimicrobiales bacterium]
MAAHHGQSEWARPAPPRPAPGGGFVAADLGAPGDEEAFARLLSTIPAPADAGAVEHAAQLWRLPVVAYRPRSTGPRRPPRHGLAPRARTTRPTPRRRAAGSGTPPLSGIRVVDLTAMWAGPLATWLLAELGAEVTKVENAVRPDGLRGQPFLFAALDRGKTHADLDLRDDAAQGELRALIAAADVLVDSFSPRVMPNLGLGAEALARLNPSLVHVAIPAFPAGSPQRSWGAYGTGVHAFCGLGDLGGERYAAPAVTYPDPLAGLAGLRAVVHGLLAAPGAVHVDASLVDAVAPLAPWAGPAGLGRAIEPVAEHLATALRERGFFDEDGLPSSPLVLDWPR